MMTRIRTFTELIQYKTFEERFEYLKIGGDVGRSTFGFDRYLNQKFYSSWEWKRIRQQVILRDNGCDLGVPGYEIHSELLIHHINPMSVDDIKHGEEWILDWNYLVTTTKTTHNAIHYGSDLIMPKVVMERSPNDTKLW
jgi:hypothetical protein